MKPIEFDALSALPDNYESPYMVDVDLDVGTGCLCLCACGGSGSGSSGSAGQKDVGNT